MLFPGADIARRVNVEPSVTRPRNAGAGESAPVVMICDRGGALAAPDGAVYIAMVPDLAKLVESRPSRLHSDVVDALVDVVIELVELEKSNEEGSTG